MFVKFWQKICEVMAEAIAWNRGQDAKNSNKSKDTAIVWKYPLIYGSFC